MVRGLLKIPGIQHWPSNNTKFDETHSTPLQSKSGDPERKSRLMACGSCSDRAAAIKRHFSGIRSITRGIACALLGHRTMTCVDQNECQNVQLAKCTAVRG